MLALAGALVALLVAAVPAATAATSFKWIAGVDEPADARQPRPGRDPQGRAAKAAERARAQPGHLGERRLLQAAARTSSPSRADGWQVWAVERRENLLEDQSVRRRGQAGHDDDAGSSSTTTSATSTTRASPPTTSRSPTPTSRSRASWGMAIEIERPAQGRQEGGRSSAARSCSAATRSAARSRPPTRPGTSTASRAPRASPASSSSTAARAPTAITPEEANDAARRPAVGLALARLRRHRGAATPASSTSSARPRRTPSPTRLGELQTWALLPDNLKPPVHGDQRRAPTATRSTPRPHPRASPPRRRTSGTSPRAATRGRWDDAGELTPVDRFAKMFSGTGVLGHDGTAWYHPLRLTIDAGAVGDGNANPAQDVLGRRRDPRRGPRARSCGCSPSARPSAASAILDATKALAAAVGHRRATT